jgi:hypothetical protein
LKYKYYKNIIYYYIIFINFNKLYKNKILRKNVILYRSLGNILYINNIFKNLRNSSISLQFLFDFFKFYFVKNGKLILTFDF